MDLQAPAGNPAKVAESGQAPALRGLPDEIVSSSEPEESYSLPDVIERHREVTDKISTQVRTISIGMLVFVWSMLNAAPGTKIADAEPRLSGGIGMVALFAILALLSDYFQYVLGKWVVDVTRANKEYIKSKVYKWPTKSVVYRAQFWCFWGKQICCMLGVVLLMLVVFIGFFS